MFIAQVTKFDKFGDVSAGTFILSEAELEAIVKLAEPFQSHGADPLTVVAHPEKAVWTVTFNDRGVELLRENELRRVADQLAEPTVTDLRGAPLRGVVQFVAPLRL